MARVVAHSRPTGRSIGDRMRYEILVKRLALRGVALVTLVPFLSLSCGGKQTPRPPGAGTTVAQPGGQPLIQTGDAAPGLTLRLTDGKQGPPAADRSTLAPAGAMSDADAAALLARLSPIAATPGDKVDFALRDRSTP